MRGPQTHTDWIIWAAIVPLCSIFIYAFNVKETGEQVNRLEPVTHCFPPTGATSLRLALAQPTVLLNTLQWAAARSATRKDFPAQVASWAARGDNTVDGFKCRNWCKKKATSLVMATSKRTGSLMGNESTGGCITVTCTSLASFYNESGRTNTRTLHV